MNKKIVNMFFKDVFAPNYHTFFFVSDFNELFYTSLCVEQLKQTKKLKLPLNKSNYEVLDLRYFIVHKATKEVVKPTEQIFNKVNRGEALPIDQTEFD